MHYADRRVVDDILAAKTLPIMISRVIVTIDSGKVKMHESDNAGIHWGRSHFVVGCLLHLT